MINEYFNRYPLLTGSVNDILGNAIDQNSFKNCIKDFNQGMIDSGLIRTTLDNQLDLDNIPNVNYLNNTSTTYGGIFYTYDPLIYTFGDELNSKYPLYIKVSFNQRVFSSRSVAAATSKFNNLVLSANVYLSKTTDFSTQIGFQAAFYSDSYPQQSYMIHTHLQRDSEIIIGDISLFNICPNVCYYAVGNPQYSYRSLMSFIIDRQNNGDVILISSYGDNDITNVVSSIPSAINYRKTNTQYLYANNTTLTDNNNYIFESMNQSMQLNNQQEMYISASQFASTERNILNYNILNANLNYFPSTANKYIIKIKLPDGNFYRYKLIKFPMYPYSFMYGDSASNRCIFIRLREDDE